MVMSMKKSKDGVYYTRCMASDEDRAKGVDDYYSAAKEPPGTWFVSSTQGSDKPLWSTLCVINGRKFDARNPELDIDRFHALVRGFHPESVENLTQNSGEADRMGLIDWCLSPTSPRI